jgi:RHS repeat-associated protein
VTEYQYRDPLFEGRQREFRGFARARSKKIGDINSQSSFTESAFLLGECEDQTPRDGIDDCGLGERWRDNPREALKGLPIFTTTYDEQGVTLSTDYSSYRLRTLYMGLDGRGVRQAFETDKQTVLYDTARGPQSGGAPLSFTAVYLEDGQAPVADRTESVPIASNAGTATMHSASVEDYFGNKTEGVDYGCVSGDACPVAGNGIAAEEVLHSVTDPGTAPVAGNTGNWLWRTRESYVTGEAHPGVRRNDIKTTYDPQGAPTSTQALLSGEEALDRYHTTNGAAVAPNPAFQSVGWFQASALYYDAFGNVTSELGPDGMDVRRCRQVSYEDSLAAQSYAESPTAETIYLGGCTTQTTGAPTGQGATLTTTAMYDRGLGVVVSAMDMTSQTTLAKYDEFGRISEVRRPHQNGAQTSPNDIPSVAIDYTLPSDSNPVPYSIIHTKTQDGATETDPSYLESYSYVDGLGRTRVALNEADPSAGDDSGWIASNIVDYDAKGAARRKYLAYFSSEQPAQFKVGATPVQPYGRQRYDAFGRQLQTSDLDGTVTLQSVYHALSTDLYDAADLEAGPHQGTYASSTKDGHGRAIATTERIHAGSALETRDVRTQYLPTGEPEVITRYSPGKTPVVRWMRYDSLGRMTLNVDPHTSFNFTTDRTVAATPSTSAASTTTLRTWRYAYNNAGDLIGTSDARGCGENFAYDGAGRLKSEDYSPCNANQGVYTAPVTATGAGYEVLYVYDNFASGNAPSSLPAGVTPTGYPTTSPYLPGRLAAVFDRGQATWTTYDARGRVVRTDKRLAKPLTTASLSASITQVLGSQLFTKTFAYDAADREVRATTGAQSAELLVTPAGGTAESAVTTTYTKRGTVKSVGSSYGDLVTSVVHSADGLVKSITYGDAAATETNNTYDARRRLYLAETERTPPGIWSNTASYTPAPAYGGTPAPPPTTFQSTLQFNRYTYDIVGNPTQIEDLRVPEEWPAGSKPVTRKVDYDDLYRATKVSYQYSTGDDTWVSPDAPDLGGATDLRRAQPMPHVTFTTRPRWQTYQYDWLGTISNSDDDQHASYDRSLGPVTTNAATGKPYQLASATQPSTGTNITGTNTRAGSASVVYDRAGYATQINLTRATTVPCVPASACAYRVDLSFDEVGRLQWAKRWSGSAYALSLYYQYDASDERVSKVSVDSVGNTRDTEYVFGSLELHRTTYNATTGVYGLKDGTNANLIYEVPYLEAHGVRLGRVAYDSTAGPDQPHFTTGGVGTRLHVFFELGDHLGSTSAVLDKDTGELVELGTYQPYGATESDYRPDRWKGFREDYRFTGKEEDIEVGLEYFGKRYLSPYLGVWVSADPLAVHAPGKADLNLYAYVRAGILKATDPLGLEDMGCTGSDCIDSGQWGLKITPSTAGALTTAVPTTPSAEQRLTEALAAPAPHSSRGSSPLPPPPSSEESWDAAKAGMQNWAVEGLEDLGNGALSAARGEAPALWLLGGSSLSFDGLKAPVPEGRALREQYDFAHNGLSFEANALGAVSGGLAADLADGLGSFKLGSNLGELGGLESRGRAVQAASQ